MPALALPRAALAALALAFSTTTAGAATAAAEAAPPDRFHAGEAMRSTSSASAALRNRGDATLRVLVWYPAPTPAAETPQVIGPPDAPVFLPGSAAADAPWADAARHPVVLLSHGFGGVGSQMKWLGTALARAGYVGIAVDHPGTNGRDGVTPAGAYAPWERAGDLKAALDLALADPLLGPHLDAGRVGVAGFSMGGFTGALLVGARADLGRFIAFCDGPARDAICDPQKEFPLDYHDGPKVLSEPALAPVAARHHADLADPRVRAAFLIDPALGPALDPASLGRVRAPVEVLYGLADPIAPPVSNALLIAHAIPGAQLVALPGVGHYDFLADCGPGGRRDAPAYCTDGPGVDRGRTHAQAIEEALHFFDAALAPR